MRSRSLAILSITLMIAALLTIPAAYAAGGDLDTTFDGDGRVTTDLGGSADAGFSLALRPTGEILVAGIVSATVDLGVVQYQPDGSTDTAFGASGLASADFGSNDQATAMVLQPDGKVVLAGHTLSVSPRAWALARFDATGTLDPSFGTGGKVTTSFSGEAQLNHALLQPDGKVVLAGFSTPSGRRWTLARYNGDGTLDSSFGSGGKVITTVGGSFDQIARAIALQPDGKIVGAGFDGSNVVVVRYNTDGSLDTTFGGTGIVVTDVPGSGRDLGFAVSILSTGKILVGGLANDAFAVLRYNTDGTLDTTFDADGIATTDFGPGEDVVYGMAELPGDRYLTVGDKRGGPRSFGLVLYNSDGSLDPSFGTGGLLTTEFGGGMAVARDVIIQPDGKAVVAGVTDVGSYSFAVGRYLLDPPPNGDPALSVDTDPVVASEGNSAANTGTVSDPDGDTVTLTASIGVVENNHDGTWDWSYATDDGPAESQIVTIDGDDGNGGTTSVSFTLTVTNVAPTITAVTGPTEPVDLAGQPLAVVVSWIDPGTADTHDVTWEWGDTTTPDTQFGATGSATQDHTYADPGVYTVTVTVEDDDGGSDTEQYRFIVVYDPDGGFVTGGGWIDSPEAACAFGACGPTTVGRAHFGFVSKYKKGATIPTGTTEFQFQAGGLNFHSSSYEWLVIAGPNAKYKGSGTINGSGDFGFILTACDVAVTGNCQGESEDTFRIKIWDKEDGDAVVYDNKMGSPDDSNDGTVLGGGNIKVHG